MPKDGAMTLKSYLEERQTDVRLYFKVGYNILKHKKKKEEHLIGNISQTLRLFIQFNWFFILRFDAEVNTSLCLSLYLYFLKFLKKWKRFSKKRPIKSSRSCSFELQTKVEDGMNVVRICFCFESLQVFYSDCINFGIFSFLCSNFHF